MGAVLPVRYEIDVERGLSVVVCDGTVDGAEIAAVSQALLGDPGYARVTRQLADLRGCTAVDVPSNELRDLARHVAASDRREGVRLALVAPRDAVFGMARLYAAHREPSGMEVRVFREMAEAEAWLGLRGEAAEA